MTDWIKLESSNLKAARYLVATSTLEIQFRSKNEPIYEYYMVPQEVYDGLLMAESHGKYFHSVIRGVFDFGKVEEE